MESLHFILGRAVDYLFSFIKYDGALLENGGRMLRLSRTEWQYSKDGIAIRFVAEMDLGEYDYTVGGPYMWYNMNYGDITDSAEIRNRVIHPDNMVKSSELRQEVAEAFAKYMEAHGKKVLIKGPGNR